MRENRPYGSEGGESGSTGLPYPYPDVRSVVDLAKDPSALNHVDYLGVLRKERAGSTRVFFKRWTTR